METALKKQNKFCEKKNLIFSLILNSINKNSFLKT